MAHYTRAPIAEAVIDLQVSFGPSGTPDLTALERFTSGLKGQFAQAQRINQVSMAVGPDADPSTSQQFVGVRLTNTVADRIAQVRRHGLSLSHMEPYSQWEIFCGEFLTLWGQYVEAFAPQKVTRMAVRYINRIVVPNGIDIDAYMNLTPRRVDGLGESVDGYFLQMVLPQPDLGPTWKAIVNSGIEGNGTPDTMSLLLDIDAFAAGAWVPSRSEVEEVLALLRNRKNEIFEACITDNVRRLIQ